MHLKPKRTGKSCKQKSDYSSFSLSTASKFKNTFHLGIVSGIRTEHTSSCQAAMGANVCFWFPITHNPAIIRPRSLSQSH